jgi:penicillin-binding protein 1A
MEGKAQRATLEQDSGAEGALLAIDNTSGDVLAMVGGRDYALSQFNRATQAERQTGSSFKPYVYTAAVEDGAKPDDIIIDAPISFGGYTPHNYENNYMGRMTLIDAFAESRNIPAIKLADSVGIQKVIDVAHRFGVTTNIPAYLPIALGAVEITLEEQVASYAVFPNDGLRVKPRLIKKVSNADGITLWEEPPAVSEVVSQQTARTMMTLFQAVIQHGTGSAAAQLKHPLGGKTGTTSEYTDAWFLGFSPSITCGVWVGFDTNQSLGDKETGARAALPIWMTWMRAAISDKNDEKFLGEEVGNSTLKASNQPSAKPRIIGLPAKPVKSSAFAQPHPPAQPRSTIVTANTKVASPATGSPASSHSIPTSSGTAARLPTQTATKPAVQPVTSTHTTGSRIRPALIPETAPIKPAGAVKPVISPSASPGEPAKPHVKTALTPQSVPAQPKVAVKPALNSNPPKQKN